MYWFIHHVRWIFFVGVSKLLDSKYPEASRHWHCVKSVQIRNFFYSVFSRIWTEYGEVLRISPYSVRMRENTDQKNSVFGHFSRSVKTRKKDLRDLWKLNVETATLSIAFILHLKLAAPKTILAEEWKLWRSTLGLYTKFRFPKYWGW